MCYLFSNEVINASDHVHVIFNGITNPGAGQPHAHRLDHLRPPAATSPPYNVAAANQLTGVTLALDSRRPGATTRWVVDFDVSATGGLSGAANSDDHSRVPGRHHLRGLHRRPGDRRDS